MITPTDVYVVLCTVPDSAVAERLARGLVEAKLAACVNVVSALRSFYAWKGEIHDDTELQLLIKTRGERLDAIGAYLEEHHPYEVPEILHVPVAGGSASYLRWLAEQTAG
jgi:periplasmic divalent cation tolerance protein